MDNPIKRQEAVNTITASCYVGKIRTGIIVSGKISVRRKIQGQSN